MLGGDAWQIEGRVRVKLLRAYSKANPGKSLKVAIRLVREAVGEKKKDGALSFMTYACKLTGWHGSTTP